MRAIWLAVAAAVLFVEPGIKAADVRPLLTDLPRAGDLALAADGQIVACVDEGTGAIVVIEPGSGQPSRIAVTATPAGGARPVALAFIDDTVLAAVCRSGDAWSLRTWRLRPAEPVDAEPPLQSLELESAAERTAGAVHLVVSRSSRWLAVVGLDPPVVRAAIGGVRIGPPSARLCPRFETGRRPLAAAVGPDDEFVLITAGERAGQSTESVAFYGTDGRCLLDLETGLSGIRDVAFSAGGSSLYVVAATVADQRAGLWRLDAVAQDGRQVIRPELVVELQEPRALVCPDPRSAVVTQGAPNRSVVQIQTVTAPAQEEP
ncbi:MAG: hypothetical protein WCC69_03390 [Pirellulales bacterium]